MFIKHYAPNRCLCIKVAKSTMCNWSLGWGLQRCHNYKIAVSSVQRMEVIVKMLKKGEKVRGRGGCVQRMEVWGGGGGGSGWIWTEKWSFCEYSKKNFFFFFGGGGGGGGSGWGFRVDVNGEVKLLWKFKKKYFFGGGRGVRSGGGGGGVRFGGSGWMGMENWSFCENSKKKLFFLGVGGGGSGWGGGIRLGVRVDVNGEVKFLWKFKKKNFFLGGGGWVGVGGGRGGGVRSGVGVGEVRGSKYWVSW